MRKDAVVLEIRKKTAIVLASDGRFLRVRNQGYHVGQRIPASEQTPVRLRPVLRRTLLVAACLVLAIGSSALAASKYLVWSYAGVDVGDISVNYTLNFRNEVLNAEGNSAEAEQLIGSLEKIPYEPVDSAVERMMDAVGEKRQEESEEPEIVVSVASFLGGTGRTEERIMEGIDRSAEKNHPDEHGENRQDDVRVERFEWQDAGQFMEDRHHPQNTLIPAETGEERQPPEETKPETTDNPPANPSTDEPENAWAAPANTSAAPENVPEAPAKTEEQPAQNPVAETEKPEEPAQDKPASEDPNNSQPPPAFQDSQGLQPAGDPPGNDMHGQNEPAEMQKPQESGVQNQTQPAQQQSQQPQQAPGQDNSQMNPGGQNRPDNGGSPPDKR